MALLRYMKPVGGLPDPRGSLSSSIPSQAIAEANKEVQKATGSAPGGGKRGPYKKYSSLIWYPLTHDSLSKVSMFNSSHVSVINDSD